MKRCIAALLLGCGLLLAHHSNGQTYKPGDRVEAEKAGKWQKATVLNEDAGFYEVEFDDLKEELTNKKLRSSLLADALRPCTSCATAVKKSTTSARAPLKLPLLQKADASTLDAAVAKTIIQATWEDPSRYVDGDVKVVNADVTVVEIGKPATGDSTFVNDGSVAPQTPIYPVTVSIKIRRYKNDRMVSSEGKYLYKVAATKTGNWAAFYTNTLAETPLETTFF